MSAKAPAFEACGVRIAEDPIKGKVVFAERDIMAGEAIFSEKAFVYATWSTDVCDACEEDVDEEDEEVKCACERNGAVPESKYTAAMTKDAARRNEVVQAMSDMESIAEVDRARCVLKCLGLFEKDSAALEPVFDLTCANFDRCLDEAKELRANFADIFPEGFTDEQMAKVIGVLNTNSHELENLGGSGLFLSACRMEHNCQPNCSFTTYDDELWMTAIRPIAKGDALSIDYGNFFYRPTEERMTSLQEAYGFICTCDGCLVEPDQTRAFKCSNSACSDGVVLPYPQKPAQPLEDPEALELTWKCTSCGNISSDDEAETFIEAEQNLLENGIPDTLEAVDELLKTSPLTERHYLIFWALDAMGCEMAALNSLIAEEEHSNELGQVWDRIIKSMNLVVPSVHHEKTIYYDNLAQVCVVLGKRNEAIEAYSKAYEISCVVSGKDCTPTEKLKELMEDPPADLEAVRAIYAKSKRRDTLFYGVEEMWEDVEDGEEEEEEEEE